MTIHRGISLMHLLLKLWNGFVVQHIDNVILTWNIRFMTTHAISAYHH